MKVSKEQKEKTRRKILEAAVELFEEKGYQKTTMRKIAKAADVGDATIYKYFPTKEHLILGFYELKAQDTIAEVQGIEDLADYELHEKIQVLVDTFLSQLLPDREFVEESLKMIFQSPMFLFKDVAPMKKSFIVLLNQFFEEAREKEEIPPCAFQGLFPEIACEYMIGIVFYWLKDDSEEFANTTQMVDLSIGLGILILQSDLIGKGTELVSFLLKTHIFRTFGGRSNIMDQLGTAFKVFKGGF